MANAPEENMIRSPGRGRDEELCKFEELYNAVRAGDWDEMTKLIPKSQPGDEAWDTIITDRGETALHVAVAYGREDIVKELVIRMSKESLEMHDSDGYTALMTAAVLGNKPMVECMLKTNKSDLISIKSNEGNNLPVVMAIDFGQIEMARYLYDLTQDRARELYPDQESQDHNGATLLTCAIYAGTLDGIHIALGLIKSCPHLALAIDKYGESGILALASMRQSFPRGNQLGFCKQRIYSSCMRIPLAPAICESRLNISNGSEQGQSNQEEIKRSVLSATLCYHQLVSVVLNFFGITQLYEMKRIHDQYEKLLSQMCDQVISKSIQSNTQQLEDGLVYDAICRAAKNGIFEFVSKMIKTDRHFLWTKDETGRNIFMLGVLHRQEKIFSILYGLDGKIMNSLTCLQDRNKNNMLHMVGIMIEDAIRQINQIPGAALQMQRELQWFKGVERIVLPRFKETKNKDGLTPRQLFTKNHADMKEKGEKWMKNTATSCTVVGTLIVTIMFQAVFSFRGDNNQSMGALPKSLNNFLFNVFIISDALSLFSSSTSVLMFLGILTSRYSEEDFLEYLPRQMIIGLLTLFCSIATMMITFSSALLIILHEQLWIAIPLICLAIVLVTVFVRIQLPILKDMIISTYGRGIFDRKMKINI